MLSPVWLRIHGLLISRRELQQMMLVRKPKLNPRREIKAMICMTKGEWYYHGLVAKYGQYSDATLKVNLEDIEKEIDFLLDGIYYEY